MIDKQRVGISEWRVADSTQILVCYGLGSCLGIALYDDDVRIGGLAHTLLPSFVGEGTIERPGRFAASAIGLIRDEMIRRGARTDRLTARLVGGANMFEAFNQASGPAVGERNIAAARDRLEQLDIPLVGEDVGANFGRSMEFDLASGEVRVRTVHNRDQVTIL